MINEMLKADGWVASGWRFISGYAPISMGHVQGIRSEAIDVMQSEQQPSGIDHIPQD